MNPERVAAERILTEVFRWELRNSPGTVSAMEQIIREAYAEAPKTKANGESFNANPVDAGTLKTTSGPSDELVKVLTEARDFTETLLTHGDASISIAAKHIWASAERILKTLK